MNVIFNTSFEVSLRILIILHVAQTRLSIDKIAALDFISIYGKDFGVADFNLHGDNNYRFSEYTVKRQLVSQAIKELVLKNYIIPHCNKKGINYSVSDSGSLFCNLLNDEYAEIYKNNVEKANSLFIDFTDRKMVQYINEYAIAMFGGKGK